MKDKLEENVDRWLRICTQLLEIIAIELKQKHLNMHAKQEDETCFIFKSEIKNLLNKSNHFFINYFKRMLKWIPNL